MEVNHLLSADNFAANHQYLEAIDCYEKILIKDPSSLKALNNIAITLEHIGRKSEALVKYEQAILLGPDVPELCSNYASLIAELGEISNAILYHQKAVRLAPSEDDFWSSYSLTLRELKNKYSISGLEDDLLHIFHRLDIDLQFLFDVSLKVILANISKEDQIRDLLTKSTSFNENVSNIQQLMWALICRTVMCSPVLEIVLKSVRDEFIELSSPSEQLEIICCIVIQNYISGGLYSVVSSKKNCFRITECMTERALVILLAINYSL